MVTWSYSSALCGVSTHMCTLGRNTKEFYFRRQHMSGPFAHNLTSVKPSGVREALSRLLGGGGSSLGVKKSEHLPVAVGH